MTRTLAGIVLTLLLAAPGGAMAQSAPADNTSGVPAPGVLVDVNAATATELEALPGIGARTAAAIVEYREKNGPFKKVEELMNVKGIGEKSFLRLKPLVTVTPPKATRSGTSSTPSQG